MSTEQTHAGGGPVKNDEAVRGVEAALLGPLLRSQVDDWLHRVLVTTLGTGLGAVLFREGRIDAVYGVEDSGGRRLLIKVHRPPVDLDARRVVAQAQHAMALAGFPAADPLAGPETIDGHVVSVETLLPHGERGNGHDPTIRRAVAAGLAEQIGILNELPDLPALVGRPPAWCRYQGGAWPTMHDPTFEIETTPEDLRWLDTFAQAASTTVLSTRRPDDLAVAHADWYCGNLRFSGGRLVAAFDWDLLTDATAVVAGITAGMFSAGTSAVATPPAPDEVAAFLIEFEETLGRRFTPEEQQAAAAGASWNLAYAARCDITNFAGSDVQPGSALDLLDRNRQEYLSLRW